MRKKPNELRILEYKMRRKDFVQCEMRALLAFIEFLKYLFGEYSTTIEISGQFAYITVRTMRRTDEQCVWLVCWNILGVIPFHAYQQV